MNISNIDWDAHSKERERLVEELLQAKIDRDITRRFDIETRLDELDDITWQAKSAVFPELLPYSNLFDALKETSNKLGVRFPDITYSRRNRFSFGISDETRSVIVEPHISKSMYVVLLTIEIEGQTTKYGGITASLEEAAIALNQWYIERCSIDILSNEYNWVSTQPLK